MKGNLALLVLTRADRSGSRKLSDRLPALHAGPELGSSPKARRDWILAVHLGWGMPGVFIAYAREDEPFARRLHDALSSSGREPVWDQDHAAVPFSAPWRQEIREAIQNSDKFIYIISPESLVSEPCGNELAQALEFSKQVIPILRRMPSDHGRSKIMM